MYSIQSSLAHLILDFSIDSLHHLLLNAISSCLFVGGLVIAKDEVHLFQCPTIGFGNEEPYPHESNQAECCEEYICTKSDAVDHGWCNEALIDVSLYQRVNRHRLTMMKLFPQFDIVP